jgi:hypothetical protein
LGVVYLTASKRSLYDLTYQHADTLSSPFFNIFSEERLGLMPPAEANTLLAALSSMNGYTPFGGRETAWLLELAGPHPFFLQIAGSYLVGLNSNGAMSEETLGQIEKRFKAEAEDHYRYLWNQLDLAEQTALLHWQTADADAQKKLRAKALIVEAAGERPRPFSRAFAEFLSRNAPAEHSTRTSTSDLTGTTLGNYRVLSALGQGGMSVVYKGYQPSLDRYVAIKVMSRNLAGDQTFLDRFQREAAGVAQLRHQNVVQMYDFGVIFPIW